MPQDALKELLQAADATAPASPVADDLPQAVRRRQFRRRRRRRRAAAATTAVLLVTVLTAFLSLRPSRQPQIANLPPPAVAPNLRDLELAAALHEQTAAHLLAARETVFVDAPPAANPVLSAVREQRDRAALILVYEADRAVQEKQTERALAAYRRTIELFPTTYWAGVARQRLKEMPT